MHSRKILDAVIPAVLLVLLVFETANFMPIQEVGALGSTIVYLSPSKNIFYTKDKHVGDHFSVEAWIKTSRTDIGGVQVYIEFNDSILMVNGWSVPSSDPSFFMPLPFDALPTPPDPCYVHLGPNKGRIMIAVEKGNPPPTAPWGHAGKTAVFDFIITAVPTNPNVEFTSLLHINCANTYALDSNGNLIFPQTRIDGSYKLTSFGDLWIEDIQPVQTLVNPPIMIPRKPTVFNVTIVSTFSDEKTDVCCCLLITCGITSWYEGPYNMKGNQKTVICTGGNFKRVGGQNYRPSGEFTVSIKVDAFNKVAESDEDNNSLTKFIGPETGYCFKDLGQLKILYVPVGFWGGPYAWLYGDPAISNDDMRREASKGDSFTKAVFPVNPNEYTSEVGGTVELPTPYTIFPGLREYAAQIAFLYERVSLQKYSQPKMGGFDRVIAVVPHRDSTVTWLQYWLGQPPNEIGLTPTPLGLDCWVEEGFWYTPAHELYHSFTEKGHCQGTGNGYWDSHHSTTLASGEGCGLIGLPSLPPSSQTPCMMHAPYLDPWHFSDFDTIAQNWICPQCYANLTGPKFKNNNDPQVLFVSGIVFSNDTVDLQPFYYFSEGYADLEPGNSGNYTLRFLDAAQQVLSDIDFNMTYEPDFNVTGFGFAVPYPNGVGQIQLLHEDTVIASRSVSNNPPTVNLIYPSNSEVLTSGENVTIQWQADDPDADPLSYTVLYTPDNGSSWIPIQTDVADTCVNWTVPNDHPNGQCQIKVIASDGVNTGEAFSNGTFSIKRHDLAVADVAACKPVVVENCTLPINVTVWNNGNFSEATCVELYANTTMIHAEPVSLAGGSVTTFNFEWNVTGFDCGNYTVSASIEPVSGEVDTTDNMLTGQSVEIVPPSDFHDIAVAAFRPCKAIVGQNYTLDVNTTILNYGVNVELSNLIVYANETAVQSTEVVLDGNELTTVTLVLNTTGLAIGNYTLSVCAEPVSGEVDTSDNVLISGSVCVSIVGDVNADWKVDVKDVYKVAKNYGTCEPPELPSWDPIWGPICDINNDKKVDVKDYYIVCKHYGEVSP